MPRRKIIDEILKDFFSVYASSSNFFKEIFKIAISVTLLKIPNQDTKKKNSNKLHLNKLTNKNSSMH